MDYEKAVYKGKTVIPKAEKPKPRPLTASSPIN